MTRFVVDLGEMELNEAEVREMDAAIKATVMSNLADVKLRRPIAVKFPDIFPWGIIVGPDFDTVQRTEKYLADRLG